MFDCDKQPSSHSNPSTASQDQHEDHPVQLQVTKHQQAGSLASPTPQRMLPSDHPPTLSKPSTPISEHHKDSVIEHSYTNDTHIDRSIITPSPVSPINEMDMIMNDIRTMKQTYLTEIASLKTEMNTMKETYTAEIALLKRQLQRQQAEMSEWIVAHEKTEAWRYEFEREASIRRSKQDVLIMEMSVQQQNSMTRLNELAQELAHTRARLPMVAATADAAAMNAAQAVASAKALAQRPPREKKKKPRKQSTPLLPTPPRHMWQTMANGQQQPQQQGQSPQPQQGQVVQPQPQQPLTGSASTSSTPTRGMSPLHTTTPPSQPTSLVMPPLPSTHVHTSPPSTSTPRMISPAHASPIQSTSSRMMRFSSVPIAPPIKHQHRDSLSDVIGNYMDEDGGMIEDELTLYMQKRSRAQRAHTNPVASPSTLPTSSLPPQQQGIGFAF